MTGERRGPSGPDLAVSVGAVALTNPVMAASGTYGLSTEFAAFGPPAALGAIVVKSLSAERWEGNPAPRLHPVAGASMLNAVGLQNPGAAAWARDDLPPLLAAGARVVASIWGRSVEEYRKVAVELAAVDGPVAWEVNLSCPNLDDPRRIFAHDSEEAAAVIGAVRGEAGPDRALWAKLSPNATDVPAVAAAVDGAGADAVTLVNTLSGMAIDPVTRRPVLANTYGGVSGPALHAVAVRAVHQVHREIPHLPIIGVGGIASAEQAVEMMLAGASAVQVGTATFFDPHAPHRVLAELSGWCHRHSVARVADLTGAVIA